MHSIGINNIAAARPPLLLLGLPPESLPSGTARLWQERQAAAAVPTAPYSCLPSLLFPPRAMS